MAALQAAIRLWRLKKLHQSVDAELRPGPAGSVELRLVLNGEVSYRREWPSRDAACDDAAGRRAELERQGWMFHW